MSRLTEFEAMIEELGDQGFYDSSELRENEVFIGNTRRHSYIPSGVFKMFENSQTW